MVANEENDSEDADVSRNTGGDSTPSSRQYSGGHSRPTSRDRPGSAEDEDDDENDDSAEETSPDTTEVDEDTPEPETTPDDKPEEQVGGEEDDQTEGDQPDTTDTPDVADEDEDDRSDDSGEEDPAPDRSPDEETSEEPTEVQTDQSSGTESSDEGMYGDLDDFRGFSIFDGLGPEAIQTVVDGAQRIHLRSEEQLFEEGDGPNGCFYLILEGKIQIVKFMRTESTPVTTLNEGDYFGEFGMFTGDDRMAGARSQGGTIVLEIPGETLDNLRDADPAALATIYENMFQAMAKRFKALAEKAEKSQFWL
jgi:hypothetical protein